MCHSVHRRHKQVDVIPNRLRLNADKTQFIWLGTAPQLAKVNNRTITLADVVIEVSDAVTCLGVVTDSQLSFANHVKKLPVSCFYQLRQLRTYVRRSVTTDAAKTLVHTVISSCVDYCNSVLYGICEVHLYPPQSALNAAAKLVTGFKFDHITGTDEPLRDELHWLPVRQNILFKLCTARVPFQFAEFQFAEPYP